MCAAKGCPPLRSEPYVGSQLDKQLDDQARRFLGNPKKNRFEVETQTLWLSPIFKWYEEDFTRSAGSLDIYVKPYLPEPSRIELDKAENVRVRHTDYDWDLND